MGDKEVITLPDDDSDDDLLISVDMESSVSNNKETKKKKLTLIDLLMELWIPVFSACKNLRLLISFFSKYLIDLTKKRSFADLDRLDRLCESTAANRVCESTAVKSALLEFLSYVGGRDNNPTSSKDELRNLIVEYRSHKLEAEGTDPFLRISFLPDTYYKWLDEYREYTQGLYAERAAAAAATSNETEDSSSELFDASVFSKSDREEYLMKQYITRLQDNGILNTWKTPGESYYHTLVRLDVYNVKDIGDKDKRNWWKYAKVRSQFLYSPKRSGKLRELLNEVAKGLADVDGLIMEERNISN